MAAAVLKYPEEDDKATVWIRLPFPPLDVSTSSVAIPWDERFNCSVISVLSSEQSSVFSVLFRALAFLDTSLRFWGHKMNWLAWWLVISMLIISNSHILFILSQTCFSPSAEIVYTSHFIFIVNMQVKLVTADSEGDDFWFFFTYSAS